MEQNLVDQMKLAKSGILGYLGIYILVVTFVGLISTGIRFFYVIGRIKFAINGFWGELGSFFLTAAILGIIFLAGLAFLYNRYCGNISVEGLPEYNKDNTENKIKHSKADVQPPNKKDLHANFKNTFNINNENNVKNSKRSKVERNLAFEQVNIDAISGC